MKFRLFVSVFALAGAAVPALLWTAWWYVNNGTTHNLDFEITLEKITVMLWPASIWLLADSGPAASFRIFLMGAAVNVILYSAIGAALWQGIQRSYVWLCVPIILLGSIWGWLLALS